MEKSNAELTKLKACISIVEDSHNRLEDSHDPKPKYLDLLWIGIGSARSLHEVQNSIKYDLDHSGLRMCTTHCRIWFRFISIQIFVNTCNLVRFGHTGISMGL